MKELNDIKSVGQSFSLSIVVLSIPFFLCFSCSKDFLNEKPNGSMDIESFYSTPDEAEIGLTGAYSRIISKHMMMNLLWLTVSADELTAATSAKSGLGSGDHRDNTTTTLWGMLGTYTEPYVGIVNLNLLLSKIDHIDDELFENQNRKQEIKGEAYFLRGWAYYMLAMVFRDVPVQLGLATSSIPEDNFMEKSSQEKVLKVALADFDKAIGFFPDQLENMSDHDARGRGSKWAAKAFKARIYLWREQWDSAFVECNDIINNGQFIMASKWTDIFGFNTENDNSEVIWQSQGQSRQEYDFIGVYRWICDADPDAPAPPFMVEKKLKDAFESPYKDIRFEYSVRAAGRKSGFPGYGGRNVKHFRVPSGLIIEGVTDESRDKNFPLIRLAEVKLMKAEAIVQSNYELGSKQLVLDILNELRARASDPEYDPREEDDRYDYDTDTGCEGIALYNIDDVNLQAVKDEKYRELAFEGVRWIDLMRWSKMEDNYTSVMALVKAENIDRLYEPIPQQQIDANKGVLKQNPGY